jgi:hypothetical protein
MHVSFKYGFGFFEIFEFKDNPYSLDLLLTLDIKNIFKLDQIKNSPGMVLFALKQFLYQCSFREYTVTSKEIE